MDATVTVCLQFENQRILRLNWIIDFTKQLKYQNAKEKETLRAFFEVTVYFVLGIAQFKKTVAPSLSHSLDFKISLRALTSFRIEYVLFHCLVNMEHFFSMKPC